MTQRREDQFFYVISSDGGNDVYPENTQSDFKISLKDPLEFPDDEEWEVGIIDVHYPFSWFNVGEVADTQMMFVTKNGVETLKFPNWQCESVDEVMKYMKTQLEKVTDLYTVGFDSLGRFLIESKSESCNVGFSKSLRLLLGLSNDDPTYWIEDMKSRAYDYMVLSEFWKSGNPLLQNSSSIDEALAGNDPVVLANLLKDNLDMDKLDKSITYRDFTELENTTIDGSIGRIAQVLGLTSASPLFKKNYKVFARHLSMLYGDEGIFPPKVIFGVKPPQLNPAKELFIHSNLTQLLDMNNDIIDLMKILNVRGTRSCVTNETFTHPTYQPVRKGGKIGLIHVYITSETGDPVPFQDGTVLMTLHFRKQRHRR